ncbi:hypothetical protein ERJ75_001260200 [Trypanosoma vivax]|nr:hypothetical protein ERJ75_001260200 [Trypanosoma vivax]
MKGTCASLTDVTKQVTAAEAGLLKLVRELRVEAMDDVDVINTENVTSGAKAGVSSTLHWTVPAKHDNQREFYKLL